MRLRAFVALEISEAKVLDSLVAFQREMATSGADFRLVERQNIHFTLKFLGDISDSMKDDADERLAKLRLLRQTVAVEGIGAFPSSSRPNIVWVGVAPDDRAKVVDIASAVIASLKGIGEDDERGFQPHATLARVRSGRNRQELSTFLKVNSEKRFGTTTLSSIRFKSSQLTPGGPIYRDVGVYTLT
jgi:2'-5' RNA ligase